jgi:hypothetical protein
VDSNRSSALRAEDVMALPATALHPASAAELLYRAELLQAEAAEVIADLDLLALLGRVGEVEQLGSSVSGLMVWRDIDFVARCWDLTPGRAWDALRPLLTQPGLTRLNYRNEAGERSPTGQAADQRYYFVTYVETAAGDEWKIDLSLWLSDAPRPHLAQLADLQRRLTDETRLAILWIKDVWHRLPTYPDEVSGVDVYDAVLEHGVRTPDEFAAYLCRRGLAAP